MSDQRDPDQTAVDTGTAPPQNPAQVPPQDATAQAVANPNVNTPSGAPATVTTPGMSPAPANTVAAPNGQPTTVAPATTAPAPQSGLQPSGAPAFSPDQQALRAKHPIATKINDVASVLAGGRQYETTIDPNTGEATRTIKPVSTAHLGMAIALEALRGALAGGAAKGPNAVGQAGVAGLAAGEQQVEQQRKQQEDTDARAQRDLQTRWSTMDNNMKMRQSAIVLGRLDRDANEQSVSDNASTIATAEQLPPITVQDSNGVKQSHPSIGDRHVSGLDSMDAKKYPVSVWNRVPDGVTDRTNPDGTPVYLDWRGKVVPEGTAGAYRATDRTYTMIHKDTAMPLTMQDESGKTIPQQYIKDLMPYVGIIPGVTKDMDKAAAGQTLGFATISRMLQGKTDIDALQSELNGTFKRLGLDSETTSKAVFDGLRRGDLSMDDLHNFQRAIVGHGGSMQPWDQLQSMMASPDTKIQASAPRIAKLFNLGSDPTNPIGDNLSRLKVQADAAKDKAISEAKDPDKQPIPTDIFSSRVADIKAAHPELPAARIAILAKGVTPQSDMKDYKAMMAKADTEGNALISQQARTNAEADRKVALQDARIEKGEKPVIGVDANNRQVLVPAGDVQKYGLSQVRQVGQAENEKITNARTLMNVFDNVDADDQGLLQLAKKLNDEGKLGPVASKFQNWLNKGGSVVTFDAGGDPNVQRLFTKLGLSTTGLMQVHVGARGSTAMLEHFQDLADAKKLSPQAFIAALDTENKYVRMKAMLPNQGAANTTSGNPAVPNTTTSTTSTTKANDGGGIR